MKMDNCNAWLKCFSEEVMSHQIFLPNYLLNYFTNYLLNAYQMAFASYPCQKRVLNALRQKKIEHPMKWSCNTKMGYYK